MTFFKAAQLVKKFLVPNAAALLHIPPLLFCVPPIFLVLMEYDENGSCALLPGY